MNYYPFGSLIPNRHGSSTAYRYGFQGQEKDDELKGEGNSLNYTFRMHDPRVGRFFATDPLEKKFPFYSPYQFSSNSPISAVELEGLETSDNKNKNETKELSAGENMLVTFFKFLNTISTVTGNNKYDNNTGDGYIANSLTGSVKGLTDISLFALGTYDLAKNGIGGTSVDDQIDFSLSNPLKNLSFSGLKKPSFGNFNLKFPKIFNTTLSKLSKLTLDGWERAMGGGRAWGRVDGEQIGFYTFSFKKGLQIDLNIPKRLQGLGYGSKFFSEALKETEAEMFTATWVRSSIYESTTSTGSSVNLTRYEAALKNGATQEQAAFKTWSGQQAAKHGFKSVTVREIENGIEATFTRQ
ncbi:hypothetical protein JJC03_03730 [Flavobacterium oreochromis]|uniref:RHS repeat-associated core domain-containing protein n=1 Tax=Flavobacterium oreochromis TaxID=2906078 RepID=UPI001CE52B80|nr:RHS repeat-associated core domain-containing protein [Flavobacterium oreochromis]QYS87785.1 hypothetical protein JJC03_03730 [Flavobacterium oreochromis]